MSVGAQNALARWAKSNGMINPQDQNQIKLYQSLQANHSRISFRLFVDSITGASTSTDSATSMSFKALAVPKGNFTDEILPAKFKPGELTDDDLEEYEIHGGGQCNVDRSNYFLLDYYSTPNRTELGKKVRTLEFNYKSKVKFKGRSENLQSPAQRQVGRPTNEEAGALSLAATGALAIAHPAAPGASSLAAPAAAGAVLAISNGSAPDARGLKREISDPFDIENQEAKKARQMKDAIKSLKEKLKDCAAKGFWYNKNKLNNSHLHYHAGHLLGLIMELQKRSPPRPKGASCVLATGACEFIATLLMGGDCFAQISHFADLFESFVSIGAANTGGVSYLKLLAACPVDSCDLPDMERLAWGNFVGFIMGIL